MHSGPDEHNPPTRGSSPPWAYEVDIIVTEDAVPKDIIEITAIAMML